MKVMQESERARNELVVDEITLDGKSIRVRNVDLPVNQVKLDPRNPRIANTVAVSLNGGSADLQKKLEDLLWADDDVRDLYRQVLINRGLIERIIVREDGTAVEGNCRTVVYRKLHQNNPRDRAWQFIPSRVLPGDIGERDVAILLGEMHVAGKNSWSPFEKAGHVYRLQKDFALTQDEIAHRLKMSKSKVNQLIRAFEVMKTKFLPKYPQHSSIRKFSYFEEVLKKPELRGWIETANGAEDQFVYWVGTNKLTQGVQVRELPAIIENAEAFKALTDDGFQAAQKVLGEENPELTSKLFRQMLEMAEALRKAQLDDVQRVRKSSHSRARRIVQDLRESLGHFIELCGFSN
jgi:hypothetical protein